MLIQFQCNKEGTLFYYQAQSEQYALPIITSCPACRSIRVAPTGRTWPDINESAPIDLDPFEIEGKA